MNLTRLNPMLETQNLSKSIQWYQDILGFQLQDHIPELGWASLVYQDIRIMLVARMSQKQHPQPAFTGSFYLYTDDVGHVVSRLPETA